MGNRVVRQGVTLVSDAGTARAAARTWLETNQARWPELRAAHFVGGIASLSDAAPFPPEKDIDLHLVFAEGSPALVPQGPFPPIVEEIAGAWPLEAGLKSVADYRSPEIVLANPEIAHHLTVDSILFDPERLLADLQGPVRAGYPHRRWVEARLAHERRTYDGAVGMRPMVVAQYGVGTDVLLLGYMMVILTATFGVAALAPPRGGGGALAHLRTALAAHDRPDLYEALLTLLGLADATPEQTRAWLAVAANLFDRAVVVRRTPHPFQHKLHAHLRPYLVDSSAAMIAAGDHREALGWITPILVSSADVLLADGTEEDRAVAAQKREFLAFLGFGAADVAVERFARALRLYDEMFDLADAVAAANPAIVD
jgi:hypothetical protein